MSSSEETQIKLRGIKQVSEQTGIPASTIRYYDQQFEEYLGLQRGAGRRRLFTAEAVERLMAIHRLLKQDQLSLRQARKVLAGQKLPLASPPHGQSDDLRRFQEEMADLQGEVTSLKKQVLELKEIQRRTLALVEGLTGP